MTRTVVKVGGSLMASPDLKSALTAMARLAQAHPILMVPGGGRFADTVRAAYAQHSLSADAGHYMAILAMEQYAHLLWDLVPARAVRTPLAFTRAQRGLHIWFPAVYFYRYDVLPHTWDLTADSIAAYVAGLVRAELLVFLKSLDGIPAGPGAAGNAGALRVLPAVQASDLGGHPCLDPLVGRYLPPGVACWIVNGNKPERLAELLATGQTTGTQIIPARPEPKPRRPRPPGPA